MRGEIILKEEVARLWRTEDEVDETLAPEAILRYRRPHVTGNQHQWRAISVPDPGKGFGREMGLIKIVRVEGAWNANEYVT